MERNLNFVSMGRVVTGETTFYFQPLPLAQLGYRPHPLALELPDALWGLVRGNELCPKSSVQDKF